MHLRVCESKKRVSINARRASILAAAIAAVGMTSASRADLVTFTPGDIVALSGGSETTNTGTDAATLLEYTPSGTFVGQLAIPASASGSNQPLTLNNVANVSHEGILTLSENGNYLSFAGYNQTAGTALYSAAPSGTVGFVGSNASTLNTSTTVVNGTQPVRAATTINGSQFYVAEAHGGSASGPGGLNYVSGVGATATQTNLGGTLDPRSLAILGGSAPGTGVLVAGAGSSSFNGFGGSGHGVYGLTGSGGGLPTSTPLSGSQINADATDGSDVVFSNEPGDSASYHGYNTLFVAGDTSAGGNFIEKYAYNGTTGKFTLVGSTAPASGNGIAIGITSEVDPSTGNVDVFYTEANGIYELNTLNSATSGFTSTTSTLLVGAASGSDFYGIANSPVPEPASMSLLGLGALGLLRRRNRRAV